MTMYKTLYPRDDVDRLYVSGKEGERGFACIEDSMAHQYNDPKTV